MHIKPIREILESEGIGVPTLNVLIPNMENYTTLLMQPHGYIEAGPTGVRHFDRSLARKQFEQFLSNAVETQADLVVTPEYAMPWDVLMKAVKGGIKPAPGKLWVLGCESIKFSELETAKLDIAPDATLLFESLGDGHGRFLGPLAYVFNAPAQEGDADDRLVILCQFKTNPMGDADHYEINHLQLGSRIYQFGGSAEQSIKLVSLICSDVFNFLDPQAEAVYDRGLVIHIQLNPKPRHEQFRLYRDRLLRFHGDATEIICLNWAGNVYIRNEAQELCWNNIAGSAWYLKPDKFDSRDETLCANHKLGLYYTWLDKLKVHALFFNYEPCVYFLDATKVVHVGVAAPLSRRRGPQLRVVSVWNTKAESWEEQEQAKDGFLEIIGDAGGARENIEKISNLNPLFAERVLALCAGKVGASIDWYKVDQLDSCTIDASEIVLRLTFCQDNDPSASDFRMTRLIRCRRLWDILSNVANLPPAIKDFSDGFRLDWQSKTPHQNAISEQGIRATVVYMGEDVNIDRVYAVKSRLAEHLHRATCDPDQSLEARQRLTVWYRNDDEEIVAHDPYAYAQIDKTSDSSQFDIGRTE